MRAVHIGGTSYRIEWGDPSKPTDVSPFGFGSFDLLTQPRVSHSRRETPNGPDGSWLHTIDVQLDELQGDENAAPAVDLYIRLQDTVRAAPSLSLARVA